MPVSVSYPGVYIEEIPSGVRTIAGCRDLDHGICRQGRARARRRSRRRSRASLTSSGCSAGCIATSRSAMPCATSSSTAARSAIIVRLYKPTNNKAQQVELQHRQPVARSRQRRGVGQKVRVRIEKKAAADPNLAAAAARLGVAPADLFDVIVRDGNTGRIETFLNLTTKESARRADRVLKNESSLIRVDAGAASRHRRPRPHAGALTDADVWTDADQVHCRRRARPPPKRSDSAAVGASRVQGRASALLEKTDLFNLLCILPDARDGDVPDDVYQEALSYAPGAGRCSIVDSKPAGTRSAARRPAWPAWA